LCPLKKSKNKRWKYQKRLDQLTEKIEDTLRKDFVSNPGGYQLVKDLYDTEVLVACHEMALPTLQEVEHELHDQISKAAHEKEIVFTKYKKIQDFDNLVESKQNLIRVLVKQNLGARERLDYQQNELIQYIQASLGNHEGEIKSIKQSLDDNIANEVGKFTSIPLPYLEHTKQQGKSRCAVVDLSLQRLGGCGQSSQNCMIHKGT